MTQPTVLVPDVHARRTTVTSATALLDLASRVACVTLTILDQYDRSPAPDDGEYLRRLARHPDVVALRRYLDATPTT